MTSSAIIAIAAAMAIAISTLGPSIGQGITAKAAMESIARQPDAAKDIRSTLIISLALKSLILAAERVIFSRLADSSML